MARATKASDKKRALEFARIRGYRLGLADIPNGVLYFYAPSGETIKLTAKELKEEMRIDKSRS